MKRSGTLLWFDRSLLIALALTGVMYVVTVLVGGVQGEYLGQPAVFAVALGALLARWRQGLGWLMATLGMLSMATLLYILALSYLLIDVTVSVEEPAGDLSQLSAFQPAFALHVLALLLAIGMATILAMRVIRRRWVLALGLGLMLATSILGMITFATGDWITYETILTLPFWPWTFGMPVVILLAIAVAAWGVGVARRVREETVRAPANHAAEATRAALLAEFVPAFAGAQRTGAAAERARFSTEMHASVLPVIRSIQSADPSDPVSPDLHTRLTKLEVELRRIADDKQNILLDEFGLVAAIEELVEGTQRDHGIPIELQVNGDVDLGRPPRQVEQVGFDICRLALDNAIRHAQPAGILVLVGVTRASLVLEVTDDGRGLGPDDIETARQAGRRGVSDMQNAARSVSGRFVIEQAAGAGTRVSFTWGRP
jgi:signal transduction histidine kinase